MDGMLSSTDPYYRLGDIADALIEKTGEKVSRSALDRYYKKVFKKNIDEAKAEQRRIMDVTQSILSVVREMEDSDTERLASNLIQAGLLAKAGEIKRADPIKLLREDRERLKLDLLREQVDVQRARVNALVKKLEAANSEARRAAERVAGRNLTPDEIAAIDRQFGIFQQEDAA